MGNIGATARAALPVVIALLLGAAPQEARADACKEAGLRIACIKSDDIAPDSLRSVDVETQSQGYFDLGPNGFGIPRRFRSYARVSLTPPSDGSLIITASATIGAGSTTNNPEAKGVVRCEFRIGSRFKTAKTIPGSGFSGSVSGRIQQVASMARSTAHKVAGGTSRKVYLACSRRKGKDLSIFRPAITVVFHPVEY